MACGRLIQLPGRFVIVVMAQVRADHNAGFGPAPERVEHLADLAVGGVADQQRDERERFENGLQKGQMHLQAVFAPVRFIQEVDLRQGAATG